ncbi:MAG: hypothetical protein M0027_04175 [Candidatus Dormibacteraeota bacterium]|jgi:hypothetical protein|nr:hypothetical protein [Candidatus Dormibacteraeota bacterium]
MIAVAGLDPPRVRLLQGLDGPSGLLQSGGNCEDGGTHTREAKLGCLFT